MTEERIKEIIREEMSAALMRLATAVSERILVLSCAKERYDF